MLFHFLGVGRLGRTGALFLFSEKRERKKGGEKKSHVFVLDKKKQLASRGFQSIHVRDFVAKYIPHLEFCSIGVACFEQGRFGVTGVRRSLLQGHYLVPGM